MSKYDFDKYINRSHRFAGDKPVGDDSVNLVNHGASCADVANGFGAVDSYNAYSAQNNADCGACRSLSGVNCEATNCKYHHPGGQCSATGITVEAPDADNKKDTFCNTFKPNGSF